MSMQVADGDDDQLETRRGGFYSKKLSKEHGNMKNRTLDCALEKHGWDKNCYSVKHLIIRSMDSVLHSGPRQR